MQPILSPPAIPALTGLRFFAALSVALAHVTLRFVAQENSSLIQVISQLSAEGMSLFFVLSGFVIHYNYSHKIRVSPLIGLLNFFIARLARLWPLYFICLGIDLVLIYYRTGSTPDYFQQAVPFYLTLTQSWFYFPLGEYALAFQFGSLAKVAWSVSTEWFFYFCYPLLCFILIKTVKLRQKLFLIIGLSSIIIITIYLLAAYHLKINAVAITTFGPIADTVTHNEHSFFRWLIYISPYLRIFEFILGATVAAVYMQISTASLGAKEKWLGFLLTVTTILTLVPYHYFIFNPPTHAAWLVHLHQCFGFALPFAIIIFCCARYQNLVTRIFCLPVILLGGEISYSFYLLHPVITGTTVRLLQKFPLHPFLKISVTLALIYGVACLSYKLIEVPARRAIRKIAITPALKYEAGEEHISSN